MTVLCQEEQSQEGKMGSLVSSLECGYTFSPKFVTEKWNGLESDFSSF